MSNIATINSQQMMTQGNQMTNQSSLNNYNQMQQGNLQIQGSQLGVLSGYIGGTSVSVPNYQYYPYYTQIGTQILPTVSTVKIEQVQNGFVVIKDGKAYIAKTKEEIVDLL